MNKKPTIFVTKVDLGIADKLVNDLKGKGFELSKPQYTVFSAKKKGLSCTLYQSGKLMVQGKDTPEFMEFYLEPEILQSFDYSYKEAADVDMTPRIGIDESGKGDIFGALCVAGVYADKAGIEALQKIKEQTDLTVLTRNDSLNNESYFTSQVARLVYAEFQKTLDTKMDVDTTKFITQIIVDEYLNEYHGKTA